eukprot:801127_1
MENPHLLRRDRKDSVDGGACGWPMDVSSLSVGDWSDVVAVYYIRILHDSVCFGSYFMHMVSYWMVCVDRIHVWSVVFAGLVPIFLIIYPMAASTAPLKLNMPPTQTMHKQRGIFVEQSRIRPKARQKDRNINASNIFVGGFDTDLLPSTFGTTDNTEVKTRMYTWDLSGPTQWVDHGVQLDGDELYSYSNGVALIDNLLYFIGCNPSPKIFDISTNSWPDTSSIAPNGETDACLANNATHLFYVGGVLTEENGDTLQIYDIAQNTWTTEPITMPEIAGLQYAYQMCLMHENILYVFGGSTIPYGDLPGSKDEVFLSNIYTWQRETGWEDIGNLPAAIITGRASKHPSDNNIWITGGYDGSNIQNTIYQFNIDTKTITNTYYMPTDLDGHTADFIGDDLYTFGGYDAPGGATDLTQVCTGLVTTVAPSLQPSNPPTYPTKQPTTYQPTHPTQSPSDTPSRSPTNQPTTYTDQPTHPSQSPTRGPTQSPSDTPSPSSASTDNPTVSPSVSTTLSITTSTLVTGLFDTTDGSFSDISPINIMGFEQSVIDLENMYRTVVVTFTSTVIIIGVAAWIDSRFIRTSDYLHVAHIGGIGFQILDMISDCFFTVSMSIHSQTDSQYLVPTVLSAFFIVFPASVTIVQLYLHSEKHWLYTSEQVRGWLSHRSRLLYLLSTVTGSSFAAVSLV